LLIDTPAFPSALRHLPNPPQCVTTNGPLEAGRAVAIVGSRAASDASLEFAYELAFQLARANVIVVSGGAIGVDAAAHQGAIAAGGATWIVSPTGKDQVYPPEHEELFADVAASPKSRMIWCFPDDRKVTRETLRYRNGVLAALSETLVVVQARYKSGSRNAAAWARSLDKPVWAVTAAPWMSDFCGSIAEIERGTARPLWSIQHFFAHLGLAPPKKQTPATTRPAGKASRTPSRTNSARASQSPLEAPFSDEEKLVFSSLLTRSLHIDEIVTRSTLPAASAATALLTLSLKDVVVESPDGFFRRKNAG
jgi:DNA processing protein